MIYIVGTLWIKAFSWYFQKNILWILKSVRYFRTGQDRYFPLYWDLVIYPIVFYLTHGAISDDLFSIASSSAFAQMMLRWLNQSWNKKILVNPIISHEVLDLHKLYMEKKRNPIECQWAPWISVASTPVVKESLHLPFNLKPKRCLFFLNIYWLKEQ